MNSPEQHNHKQLARIVGLSMIATIVVGILTSIFISYGININLSADVEATASNMLDAELRVRAKAYLSILGFALNAVVILGLYRLLHSHGKLLAGVSFLLGVGGAVTVLMGAVFSLNVAELISAQAYDVIIEEPQRLMLVALQVTSDYTSFHLGLVLSAAANAGFFYLFLQSRLIPRLIAGWGLFASLFVATMIVARDFAPVLGNSTLTMAFMLSNLIALVSTALYLVIKGVRTV